MNKNKGITLIALVITIIVLIILAGVSINLILGQYGIVNRATSGAETYSEKQAKEKLELELSNMYIEKNTNINYNENDYLTTKLSEKGFSVNGNIVIVDGYQFQIDRTVPKIMNSLGKGIENNEIILTASSNLATDYTKSTIKIEITYAGTLKEVNLNGESLTIPEAQDGKYVIEKEVEKNGNYNVFVKDSSDGYKIANVEVKNISEDTNIGTVEQFIAFRDRVNAGATYEGRTVTLTSNLDLSSVCGENVNGAQVSWEPIGTETNPFKGTFDGNKKMITNLYINSSDNIQGLFGNNNGIIQELILENGTIYASTSDYIGTIVGINNGTIRNCNNKANIIGQSLFCCGGITGWSSGKIQQCVNKGNIQNTNRNNTGGIVGDSRGLIENCFNLGTVQGGQYVGGIVGVFYFYEQGNESTVKNCYNVGNIIASTAAGSIAAKNGSNATWTGGTIQNCYYLEGTSNKGIYSSYNAIKNEASSKTLEQMQNLDSTLGDAFVADGKIKNAEGAWVDNKDAEGNIIYINNGYPILKWQIGE